jgi:hypothetical protein
MGFIIGNINVNMCAIKHLSIHGVDGYDIRGGLSMRYETRNYNTILVGEPEAITFLETSLLKIVGLADAEMDFTEQRCE